DRGFHAELEDRVDVSLEELDPVFAALGVGAQIPWTGDIGLRIGEFDEWMHRVGRVIANLKFQISNFKFEISDAFPNRPDQSPTQFRAEAPLPALSPPA